MPARANDITGVWIPRDEIPEELVPATIFGNDRPTELEMGCGKGLFLDRESARRPEVNFLGVDWAMKYAKVAAERLAKRQRTNVRVLSDDIRELVLRFPDDCFSAAHAYFPDPWWKQRHKKRRFLAPPFPQRLARVLRPGAMFHFVTDVPEYFDVTLAALAEEPAYRRVADPPVSDPEHDLDYLTHFERKYRLEGRSIYRACFERTEESSVPTVSPATRNTEDRAS